MTTARTSLDDVLQAAGLAFVRRDAHAEVSVASGASAEPTRVHVTDTPFELLFEARTPIDVDGRTLVYLNELNLWMPPGVCVGRRDDEAVLRGSLPIAEGRTPAPEVVRALGSMFHVLLPIVAARRMPTDAEQQAMRGDESAHEARFEEVVTAFREELPLARQPDGAYMAGCNHEDGRFLARLAWTPLDGLSFDALGVEVPTLPFESRVLTALTQLNGQLPIGAFALWQKGDRGLPVFRRALPLGWLLQAAEAGTSLVSEDFVMSCIDNAAAAWEALDALHPAGSAKALA